MKFIKWLNWQISYKKIFFLPSTYLISLL